METKYDEGTELRSFSREAYDGFGFSDEGIIAFEETLKGEERDLSYYVITLDEKPEKQRSK